MEAEGVTGGRSKDRGSDYMLLLGSARLLLLPLRTFEMEKHTSSRALVLDNCRSGLSSHFGLCVAVDYSDCGSGDTERLIRGQDGDFCG